jgi:uncharacterized membrane protein
MSSTDPRPFPDDDLNPYAPPRSEVGPEPELLPLGELTPTAFTIGDVLTRSWEIYRDRMGTCIGIVVGCMGLNVVTQIVLSAAQQVAPMARDPQAVAFVVGVFGSLAVTLFQIWLNIGQAIVMLDIARGREVTFADVFTGARFILRVLLAGCLMGLILIIPPVLGVIPGVIALQAAGKDSPVGIAVAAVGFLAGLAVSIYSGLRLSQFYYLIIDRDAGVADSLRLSYGITRGKSGAIFVLGLVTTAINLAGVLACFVGLILTMPLTVLIFIVTYLALTGQPTDDPYGKGEQLAELEPL